MTAGAYATMQKSMRSSRSVRRKSPSRSSVRADSVRRSQSPGGRFLGRMDGSMREMQLFPDDDRNAIVPSLQRLVDDRDRAELQDFCQCDTPQQEAAELNDQQQSSSSGQAMGIQQQSSSSIDHISSRSVSRPPYVCCPHGRSSLLMDRWFDTMIECKCDESSRMSLISLAQYSPEGYDSARQIMNQLTRSRLEPIRHGSAFLASQVEKARRELNPEGETLYGGLGGQDRRRV